MSIIFQTNQYIIFLQNKNDLAPLKLTHLKWHFISSAESSVFKQPMSSQYMDIHRLSFFKEARDRAYSRKDLKNQGPLQ